MRSKRFFFFLNPWWFGASYRGGSRCCSLTGSDLTLRNRIRVAKVIFIGCLAVEGFRREKISFGFGGVLSFARISIVGKGI